MIVFFIAIPQRNLIQSLTISILIFEWFFSILLLGVPSWRDSARKFITIFKPVYIPFIFVIVPYFLILISGGTTLASVLDFILWYLLPTIIFLLPEFLEAKTQQEKFKQIRIVLNIIAVIILWIGFDNRYTNSLFVGFEGASYALNALWIACVIMVTFGRYVGIENPENEHDKGLKPNKYGAMIAIIAMPLASIIIVPFGLLTGFLSWDPQLSNLLFIIIDFIGVFLTIALQEEFVFRGIIQNELTKLDFVKSSHHYENAVIVLVTIAFALSHWNNDVPPYVYYYFVFAFIAGLAYAYSYKKGGLFSSMFAHTLVDWMWALLFKRV